MVIGTIGTDIGPTMQEIITSRRFDLMQLGEGSLTACTPANDAICDSHIFSRQAVPRSLSLSCDWYRSYCMTGERVYPWDWASALLVPCASSTASAGMQITASLAARDSRALLPHRTSVPACDSLSSHKNYFSTASSYMKVSARQSALSACSRGRVPREILPASGQTEKGRGRGITNSLGSC